MFEIINLAIDNNSNLIEKTSIFLVEFDILSLAELKITNKKISINIF